MGFFVVALSVLIVLGTTSAVDAQQKRCAPVAQAAPKSVPATDAPAEAKTEAKASAPETAKTAATAEAEQKKGAEEVGKAVVTDPTPEKKDDEAKTAATAEAEQKPEEFVTVRLSDYRAMAGAAGSLGYEVGYKDGYKEGGKMVRHRVLSLEEAMDIGLEEARKAIERKRATKPAP